MCLLKLCERGPFSMKGIWRGYLLCKKVRVWTLWRKKKGGFHKLHTPQSVFWPSISTFLRLTKSGELSHFPSFVIFSDQGRKTWDVPTQVQREMLSYTKRVAGVVESSGLNLKSGGPWIANSLPFQIEEEARFVSQRKQACPWVSNRRSEWQSNWQSRQHLILKGQTFPV